MNRRQRRKRRGESEGLVLSCGRWWWLWAVVVCCFAMEVQAAPPVVESAQAAPEIDALLQQTEGWIGADGAYSVAVSPERTLWLFSDTWVGSVREGKRTEATIVNNTVGVQRGSKEHLTFSMGRQADGKAALIQPADGRGWFWLQAGEADGNRLWLFLNQIEKGNGEGVFGFKPVGMWLGSVANAERPPEEWRVEQVKLPNVLFSEERTLVWGAAVLRVGDDLYIYGTDERRGWPFPNRQLVVAKVPLKSVSNFAEWRYFRDGAWVAEFEQPSLLAGEMGSEFSVTPFGKGYLNVYTQLGLSPKIMARTAEKPEGPWSEPTVVYECAEMARDKKLFCYAAKAHPSLSTAAASAEGEVVVSYVVNSFDFWQVAREAELYWPRFVRVRLRVGE